MIALLAAFSLLTARAGAQAAPDASSDTVRQDQLREDADALQAMTDAEFLTPAGRARVGDAPTQGQSVANDNAAADPDSRLTRPRTLSMVYETLAAYEYDQAAKSGLLPAPELERASARVKLFSGRRSLLADPGTRRASRSYARLSARLRARPAPQAAGRAVGASNKKLSALKASLSGLDSQLSDPALPAARKAELHAKAGRVYERMAAAARYQASVAVVSGSVLDDSGAAGRAAETPDAQPNAAPKARKAAVARKSAKPKARVAEEIAPAAAPPAAPPEEDEVRQGVDEMNHLEQDMHDQIQKRQSGH